VLIRTCAFRLAETHIIENKKRNEHREILNI